jgi:hypothetical protein
LMSPSRKSGRMFCANVTSSATWTLLIASYHYDVGDALRTALQLFRRRPHGNEHYTPDPLSTRTLMASWR